MSNRLSKTEYYLGLAKAVSKRATCLRRRYGAVIVNKDVVAGTGYCGAPRGKANCIDLNMCEREKQNVKSGERYELCKSVHAEMNAIINAGREKCIGGTIYIYGEDAKTGKPIDTESCMLCKRTIINSGLKKIIVQNEKGIQEINVDEWIRSDSC